MSVKTIANHSEIKTSFYKVRSTTSDDMQKPITAVKSNGTTSNANKQTNTNNHIK